MGLFSFFKTKKEEVKKEDLDYNMYFTKDLMLSILNSSSSMMLFFAENDGWIGANKKFLETFDFTKIEDFKERYSSIKGLFLSESEDMFIEDDKSWLDYIQRYKPDGYEVTIRTADDAVLFINAKCYFVEKNTKLYVLELEDITRLHEAEAKVKEVEKLKSRFLSNIGQEFRTPMNGILGFIELFAQTSLDKKQSEYLNMIKRSSRNLMGNIETLLDLSQMQGGKLQINEYDFTISHEVEDLIYNFYMEGKENGVSVLSFIDPKLPAELHGDFRKIKQVLKSLIQNSLKFTPRGGRVIIEVKLLKKQVGGACSIGFSVKDNGKGIENEQIAFINEPFSAGNDGERKLGVGLSLANGLVQLLGGELHIKSQEGYGSYFTFTLDFKESKGQSYPMVPKKKAKVLLLDRKRVDDANFLSIYLRAFAIDVIKSNAVNDNVFEGIDVLYAIADQAEPSMLLKLGSLKTKVPLVLLLNDGERLQTNLLRIVDDVLYKPLLPGGISKHLSKVYKTEERKEVLSVEKKVQKNIEALVVEDNLINQKLVQILLEGYGIRVSIASNGNEAVDLCEKNYYDIIFMDINMPDKDGITATQEIKAKAYKNQNSPIVALTALAMEGDREMLLGKGLDDYISKPLTREKLEVILNKYLNM